MKKLAKMSLIISTLSLLSGCAKVDEFPNLPFYVADVTNQVCAKYILTDRKKIKFYLMEETPLVAKGPCDRMTGFALTDFNTAKSWIRDQIDDQTKSVQYAP
jgi:hypothetical protein